MSRLRDLALGSYEAAALMGVHFTRPARMHAAGRLDGRETAALPMGAGDRRIVVYSARSCEEDYAEYERRDGGRPRDWLHLRPAALQRLAKASPAILYEDAIGVMDAAKLLGLHYTGVYKLIERGKLVARKPWNPRRKGSRVMIVSRKSVEANRREVAAQEASGKKRGRKRNLRRYA